MPSSDIKTMPILLFIWFVWFIERRNDLHGTTTFKIGLNRLALLFFLFSLINCIICNYYREQSIIETLIHWSNLFLLFMYFPLRSLKLKIDDWESVILYLFSVVCLVFAFMTLFPDTIIFDMTSSNEKFERDLRVRIYGDGALVLGNIFCFNKALVYNQKKRMILWIGFSISFLFIVLMGFRMVIVSCLIIYLYILLKLNMLKVKYGIIGIALIGSLSLVPAVQNRVDEMLERNAEANYNNDKYVRVMSIVYYYTNYFKSDLELLFGSGMVQRQISSTEIVHESDYASKYSKEVSYLSTAYHFFPVDWGLIGLSWEAGIPVVLIIYGLTFYLVFKKTPKQYYYISAWALIQILISINNPLMYHYHNMIFYTMVLVIYEKVKYLEKDKSLSIKC